MLELIYKVNEFIVNPLILLLISVAIVVFFWGVFEFVFHSASAKDEQRERGKKNMLWGLIGFFVMVGVFGLIRIILGTFGIEPPPNILP